MMIQMVPLVLLLGLTLVKVASTEWQLRPYDDDSFNTNAEFGANVTLRCNDSRIDGYDYHVDMWILPNLDVMRDGDKEMIRTLDGEAVTEVIENGTHLAIRLVQDHHFGLYYCMVTLSMTQEQIIVKKGLNFRGAYFANLWHKYEDAAVLSMGMSAAWVVFFTVATIVYLFQNQDVGDSLIKTTEVEFQFKPEQDNTAFSMEPGNVITSVEMKQPESNGAVHAVIDHQGLLPDNKPSTAIPVEASIDIKL